MKKIFLLFIFLIPALCFSQGKYGDIEFSVGMPFTYGWLNENDTKDTIRTKIPFSFGIGAANYNALGNNNWGIAGTINLIFPGTLEHTSDGQTNAYKGTDDIMLLDFQLGLAYHLLGKEAFLRIPISFGLHFLIISGVLESSPAVTQELYSVSFGLGGSAAAEVHFNPTVYFFTRLGVYFDFLTLAEYKKYTGVYVGNRIAYFIDGKDYNPLSLYIGIAPTIGIGIKIDGIIGNANK